MKLHELRQEINALRDDRFRKLFKEMASRYSSLTSKSRLSGLEPGDRVKVSPSDREEEIQGTVEKILSYGFVMRDDHGIQLGVSPASVFEKMSAEVKPGTKRKKQSDTGKSRDFPYKPGDTISVYIGNRIKEAELLAVSDQTVKVKMGDTERLLLKNRVKKHD